MKQIVTLSDDIAAVAQALERAEQTAQPALTAFWEAHRELIQLHANRAAGEPCPKQQIINAYDRRLHAGHAAFPFTQPVRILAAQLHDLIKERDYILKQAVKRTKQLSLLD
jgi:hypothetical protein